MQDPELLEATGSELLTLDEELENQQSWRDDETKCTFIILARDRCSCGVCSRMGGSVSNSDAELPSACGANNSHDGAVDVVDNNDDDATTTSTGDFVRRHVHAMVGDVNLFLSDEEEEDDNNGMDSWWTPPTSGRDPTPPPPRPLQQPLRRQAEVDIMIADTEYRGRGLGQEAVTLMMMYGAKHMNLTRFFAKIHETNVASKNLFQNKLGFAEIQFIHVFQQYELELKKETNQEMMDYLSTMNHGRYDLQTFACPLLLPE